MELSMDFLRKYEDLMNEDVEKALDFSNKTLEKTQNTELYIYIGECYMALNRFEEAIDSIDKGLNNGSKNVNFAKSLKGESLFYLERYEESKEIFNELLKERPNSFFSIAYLTDIDINLGNYEEGVKRAEEVLKDKRLDDKDSAYIEVNLGWIKLKYLNRGEEALRHFNHALELDDTLGTAYIGFAQYYLNENEYFKAVENFERAIDLGENTLDVYLGMGKAYKGLGQLEDALEYFKVVYGADPSNEEAFKEITAIEKELL